MIRYKKGYTHKNYVFETYINGKIHTYCLKVDFGIEVMELKKPIIISGSIFKKVFDSTILKWQKPLFINKADVDKDKIKELALKNEVINIDNVPTLENIARFLIFILFGRLREISEDTWWFLSSDNITLKLSNVNNTYVEIKLIER